MQLDAIPEEEEKKAETTSKQTPSASFDFPPWLTRSELFEIRKLKDYPVFELHEELVYLVKWLEPTTLDKLMRERVLHDLNALFEQNMPKAVLHPFGSFLTNLYYPFFALPCRALPESDLDIMVECKEHVNYLRVVEKVWVCRE